MSESTHLAEVDEDGFEIDENGYRIPILVEDTGTAVESVFGRLWLLDQEERLYLRNHPSERLLADEEITRTAPWCELSSNTPLFVKEIEDRWVVMKLDTQQVKGVIQYVGVELMSFPRKVVSRSTVDLIVTQLTTTRAYRQAKLALACKTLLRDCLMAKGINTCHKCVKFDGCKWGSELQNYMDVYAPDGVFKKMAEEETLGED